jgi:hypothetical protein
MTAVQGLEAFSRWTLVEGLDGRKQEVTGSIPVGSIRKVPARQTGLGAGESGCIAAVD